MSETEINQLTFAFKDDQIAWEAVFKISYVQGVAPVLYKNLKKCHLAGLSVPADILEKFEHSYIAAQNLQAYRNEKLEEILTFFSSMGEDVMLLKGAAYNAAVFRDSALAVPGDIDLLVKSATFRFSEKQLQYIYSFNTTESFEIDFQSHHDLDLSQMLSLDYQGIWQDSQSIDLFGSTCFIMGPEDLLIFACVNSCRKRFFHLKALFNISEIIRSYPEIDWKVVTSKVKSYQCENMTYTALLAAYCTLGCQVPENLAELFNINSMRLKLIRYLVANMSFSDLADRTLFLNGGSAVTRLTDRNKWNRSGLLLLGAYSTGQFLRRLKALLRH